MERIRRIHQPQKKLTKTCRHRRPRGQMGIRARCPTGDATSCRSSGGGCQALRATLWVTKPSRTTPSFIAVLCLALPSLSMASWAPQTMEGRPPPLPDAGRPTSRNLASPGRAKRGPSHSGLRTPAGPESQHLQTQARWCASAKERRSGGGGATTRGMFGLLCPSLSVSVSVSVSFCLCLCLCLSLPPCGVVVVLLCCVVSCVVVCVRCVVWCGVCCVAP